MYLSNADPLPSQRFAEVQRRREAFELRQRA
jgi:hypothetical protein